MMDTCFATRKAKRFWTLGWEKREIDGLDTYTHGGGIFGFSTRIGYIPEKNISIIILSNLVKEIKFDEIYSAKFSFVDEITENIIKILNNKQVTYLPVPKGKADKKVCGTYKFDETHTATVSIRNDSLFLSTNSKDDFTVFDYNYNKEIIDTTECQFICKQFAKSILVGNFDDFEQYASEEMKKRLFNSRGIAQINGAWKNYSSQSGLFKSYNISNKIKNNYTLSFHFEKAEIIMQLSFNDKNLIQGLFFLNVLPKSNEYSVNLIPIDNNEYIIDGYKYGGYNDYKVIFDKTNQTITFSNDVENFMATKIN